MLTDIHLQNFRSYLDDSFDFDSGVNIIIGKNGSGKTNLLEAVMMICKGSSYRNKDHHLISIGSEWSRIEVHTPDQTRILKLEQTAQQFTKTFEINTKPTKRLKLEQTLPIVLFEPSHLNLISSSPEARRTYIDEILEQTLPGFKQALSKYKRIIYQRNNLLKSGTVNKYSIFAWNIQLSEIGGQIYRARQDLINIINHTLTKTYQNISKTKVKILLKYHSEIEDENYETKLLSNLEEYSRDILRGHTLHGPHRDDIKIYINGNELGMIGSRGETRTIILALKLIEAEIIEKQRGIKPILLLDDVFGELDQQRRKLLTTRISDYQSFITTTDADVAIKHFDKSANIIITQ